jgi:integrase/recombinase XerD
MYLTQSLSEAEQFVNLYKNSSTYSTYKLALKVFHDYLVFHDIRTINGVTLDVAEQFKADIGMDYSPKTCSMYITIIKQFVQFLAVKAQSEGKTINTQFLLVKGTKVSSREQKTACLTEQEVNRMIKVIYNLPNDKQSNMLKVMVFLMVNAGLRETELVNLTVDDLKLQSDHYVIKVLGKGMKFRYITLSRAVTAELQKVLAALDITSGYIITGDDGHFGRYVPGKPLDRSNVFRRIKKLAAITGIDKDISPHSLRRTCATIMYKRGTPIEAIQRVMGHDNPATTQRYIDMEIDIEMSKEFALDLTKDAV